MLRHVFAVFLEELLGRMAGHVSLPFIVGYITQQYGHAHFGDLRITLLGLLGARQGQAKGAAMSSGGNLLVNDSILSALPASMLAALSEHHKDQVGQAH
eukprot:gene25407-11065_t